MKKWLMMLLISLLIPMNCFSDTISVDTLKLINIIFVDRDRLENENNLLKKEISSYKELEQMYIQSDSLKSYQIELYRDKSLNDEYTIKKLKRTRKGILAGSGILIGLLTILSIFK